ncbi:MAG: gliding motility-associated C-terminal domain-containing protein [Spirosomataceae bacterium]
MKLLIPALFSTVSLLCCTLSQAAKTADCDSIIAPKISSEKQISCAGQPVILKASGCEGTVVWSTKKTGNTLTVYPAKTTTYRAYCKKEDCKSAESEGLTITIHVPATPIVKANKSKVCFGESVVLTAAGCSGDVIWSNGMNGKEITVKPIHTAKYTATCRMEGCVSCFADDIIIVVMGEPMAITASKKQICQGESSILEAAGHCAGLVKWSNGKIGKTLTVRPEVTADYWVVCETEGCEPVKSSVSIQVNPPLPPTVKVNKNTICAGEKITLSAEGCISGVIRWSNAMEGRTIDIQPKESTQYSAICLRGDCQSSSSAPVSVSLTNEAPALPQVVAELKNVCPFVTVDLSAAVTPKQGSGLFYEARTGPTPDSPLVPEVGAVSENRTYYIFARNAKGCYSAPAPVIVSVNACDKPLALCVNNPATAKIAKNERTTAGNYYLEGKIGGSANSGHWTANGTGSFNTSGGLSVIYTPSPEDRLAGKVTIRFVSDDPDGDGPCKAGADLIELKIAGNTDKPKEMIGVNKLVKGWTRLGSNLFEIEYAVQVVNMGANDLVEVQIADSLDKVFKNGAVLVGKPEVRAIDLSTGAETVWSIDTSYTGREGNYELLVPEESSLQAGQARSVVVKAKVDFTNAQDSIYFNTAFVTALDINGNVCADKSANGNWPDLNQNEDPTDDTEATPIVLNTLREGDNNIFIPEGFSPNSDGINDFFVIKKPINVHVSLEIYNRWGGLVYKAEDYKNDWNGGTVAQTNVPAGTYFYVIKLNDGREFSRFMTISR